MRKEVIGNATLYLGGIEMTDLDITRLCAEAMGWPPLVRPNSDYNPLHDDAQAMALVKKFHIALGWNPGWAAFRQDTKKWCYGGERDLNYTICLCVADMQSQNKK